MCAQITLTGKIDPISLPTIQQQKKRQDKKQALETASNLQLENTTKRREYKTDSVSSEHACPACDLIYSFKHAC